MSTENAGGSNAADSEDERRDRREHGGAPQHPDVDALARRTERERVEAGLDDFDPDDVPPATDEPPLFDPTDSDAYREAAAEAARQLSEGELYPLSEKKPFPPGHYDRS